MSCNEDEDERSFRHVGREINDDRRDRAVYRRGNGAPIGTAGGGAIDKSVGQRGYEWLAVACRTGRFIR